MVLEPFMSPDRKLYVSVQDFCNILGGGLVSFSTMSPKCVQAAIGMRVGAVVAIYDWQPSDVIGYEASEEGPDTASTRHRFMAICWRCTGRTLNVMCSKIGEWVP